MLRPRKRRAGRERRLQPIAGDHVGWKRQTHRAAVEEPIKKSLASVELMIREIQTTEPRILGRQFLRFAKLLDQAVLSRPVEPICRAQRVAFQVVEHGLPLTEQVDPFRLGRQCVGAHEFDVAPLNFDRGRRAAAGGADSPLPIRIARNRNQRRQWIGEPRDSLWRCTVHERTQDQRSRAHFQVGGKRREIRVANDDVKPPVLRWIGVRFVTCIH